MAARVGVVGADPHEPVHAVLGAEVAIGVLARHEERGALDARLLPLLQIHHLDTVAVPLGPAEVHPVQHVGPVLRLGAAGSGVDGEDRVHVIVLAAEHHLELGGIGALLEIGDERSEILLDGLALAAELEEHFGVVEVGEDLPPLGEDRFDLGAALVDDLGGGRITPEGGVGHARVQLVELDLAGGKVKDSSGARRGGPSPRRGVEEFPRP